ncbi:MAG: alcohol dehydrogenase catalytic domain-containing protein, partial [Planctomycetota bacterium]|nr:alcohol dehydrogenase catalytic domain-containing protein [Planctomycetota bacterium]
MRALVIPRNGPPSVFEERELPDRRLAPKDVRIRVAAAGVNFADLMGRIGLYPDAPDLPYAPGYEVAGVIEEAGAQVDPALAPGTRVMSTTRFWGYADLVRAPQPWVGPIPESVDFTTAAAVPVNYLTAYLALLHSGAAKAGERVLVHGGAGGVGLAALDLSRGHDLAMYATAGSDEKCARLEG